MLGDVVDILGVLVLTEEGRDAEFGFMGKSSSRRLTTRMYPRGLYNKLCTAKDRSGKRSIGVSRAIRWHRNEGRDPQAAQAVVLNKRVRQLCGGGWHALGEGR